MYVFLAVGGTVVFPRLFNWAPNMYMVASAMGVFTAAAIANAIVLRIYEGGQLADIGLGWSAASRRNLLIGVGSGAAAALLAVLIPVAIRAADWERSTAASTGVPAALFVLVVLVFGAAGEEMLFRGYAFQALIGYLGPFATILPFGALFALAHFGNPGQNSPAVFFLAPLNTALWGVLLGFAFVRSGDLWLPIGLHYGWNAVLPLVGANVSGFMMGLTGITLRTRGRDVFTGGEYGPEGSVITTLLVCGLAWWLYRGPIERQASRLVERAETWL